MRDPVEITKGSAVNVATWRMKEILDSDKNMPALKRFAMQAAIQKGGGVEEIAEILYAMGLRLTIDRNNPEHKSWIDARVVCLEAK